MASEIVGPAAPDAMRYEAEVYLGWVKSLGDAIMCKGVTGDMLPGTLADIGGLIYALSAAAQEQAARESGRQS